MTAMPEYPRSWQTVSTWLHVFRVLQDDSAQMRYPDSPSCRTKQPSHAGLPEQSVSWQSRKPSPSSSTPSSQVSGEGWQRKGWTSSQARAAQLPSSADENAIQEEG